MKSPFHASGLPVSELMGSLYQYPKNYTEPIDTPIGVRQHEPTKQDEGNPLSTFLAGLDQKGGIVVGPTMPTKVGVSPGGQKALDFLQERIGKKINTYPASEGEVARGTLGYFSLNSPFGGGINNPTERDLYLSPSTGYQTLFHEAGHARDPSLRSAQATKKEFNPAFIQSLQRPSERLGYLYSKKFEPTVKAETEAQAYSGFQLPRFAQANPDLSINYQGTFNSPWFKEYPASFAQKAIEGEGGFYRAELPRTLGSTKDMRAIPPSYDESSDVAGRIFTPVDVGQKALSFALDPELRQKEKDIVNAARQYVDTRLNPYQQAPSQWAPDYWAPRGN